MATRQPRRTRRRSAPATSLPRPTGAEAGTAAAGGATQSRRQVGHHRTHHVTTDYRYVRKDLVSIAVIGSIALAFIIAMAIYIGAI
ncbi:MAG: hypothetical protein WD557_16940 [Dehalococcoidia bacterium]